MRSQVAPWLVVGLLLAEAQSAKADSPPNGLYYGYGSGPQIIKGYCSSVSQAGVTVHCDGEVWSNGKLVSIEAPSIVYSSPTIYSPPTTIYSPQPKKESSFMEALAFLGVLAIMGGLMVGTAALINVLITARAKIKDLEDRFDKLDANDDATVRREKLTAVLGSNHTHFQRILEIFGDD